MKKDYIPEVWMTVDPGLGGTGYAVWTKDWKLLHTGILRSRKDSLSDRCEDIGRQLAALAHCDGTIATVYFEMPAFHGSAGGQVTAKSGALVKLVFCVGWISSLVHAKCKVGFVPVRDWKGQLPKDIVWSRIRKILPGCKAESHALDAVGIGLYLAGRL